MHKSHKKTSKLQETNMETEFDILFGFLDRMEPEVSGRTAEDLSDDLKEKLKRFARGGLSAEERTEVVPVLLQSEEARLFLVGGLA